MPVLDLSGYAPTRWGNGSVKAAFVIIARSIARR